MSYTFHWRPTLQLLPDLLWGAVISLQIAGVGLVVGIVIGVILALSRLSGIKYLSIPAAAWVETARNTPSILQVYFFYFGLGAIAININAYYALLFGIVFNNAGYLCEIYRGGMKAIPQAQHNAARSLGMSASQSFMNVILPQLMKITFYPMTNQLIFSVLMTSLGIIVGLDVDLMGVAQKFNIVTFRTFEIFIITGLIYYAVVKILVILSKLVFNFCFGGDR